MNALFKCIVLLCRGAEPIQYLMNPNVAYILLIITVMVHVILFDCNGVLNFFEREGEENINFFLFSDHEIYNNMLCIIIM